MKAKMKPEIKELWLKALRSDEYTQTKRVLRDSKGFCCLGVLSDLAIKSGEFSEAQWRNNCGIMAFTAPGEGDYQSLTESVRIWAGLSGLACRRETHTLANMNDNGVSFAGIADYIEKEL